MSDNIRISGYGSDIGTPRNQVQQTHTGPYTGESRNGANFWHSYQTDTMGGNSGSPIIWANNGFAIGIHTNAGCNRAGTGSNNGISFEHDPLETALQDLPGLNTVYVDTVQPPGSEDGTIFTHMTRF